jgi:predicted AAA+ superfamily ATPase
MVSQMYNRLLALSLPKGQSAFLWGARKTGKSTFLKAHFPGSVYYDLLKTDLTLRLSKTPSLLREEILALPPSAFEQPIIIDEIQKIPALLDEVHWLIENTPAYFILCGSSARKLRQISTNMLGGRAWKFSMFPLVFPEIPDFNLLHALQNGLIPSHYQQETAKRSLKAYIEDYLTQEIQAEGLVRNLPQFARFLDVFAFSHGDLVNYSHVARDCAVDSKTVKAYYQIVVDTLMGNYVQPFYKKSKRDHLSSTPKFYLFDVGVAQYLQQNTLESLKGIEASRAFEHFIFTELHAYAVYSEKDFDITYWRTKTGLEVDFVLKGGEVAIECKSSSQVRASDIKGLIAFDEEFSPKRNIVVSQDLSARRLMLDNHSPIDIMPWREFLSALWAGELI